MRVPSSVLPTADEAEIPGEAEVFGDPFGERRGFRGRHHVHASRGGRRGQQFGNARVDVVFEDALRGVVFAVFGDGFGRFGVAHAVAFPERIGKRRPDEGAEFPQVGFVDAEMAQGVLHRAGDSLHGVGQRAVEVEKEVFPVHILYKKPGLSGPGRDYGFIRRNE